MNDFNTEYAAVFTMMMERERIRLPKDEFLENANALSESASNDLVGRIGRHFAVELTQAGFQEVEVHALMLEREEEQLDEWRLNMTKLHRDLD